MIERQLTHPFAGPFGSRYIQNAVDQIVIAIGVGIAAIAALFRVPVLAFAVGVYLPLSTMAALFLGGLMRYLMTRNVAPEEAENRREQGVLFGSGLVGGGGLTGVLLALWVGIRGGKRIVGFAPNIPPAAAEALALVAILMILACVVIVAKRRHTP